MSETEPRTVANSGNPPRKPGERPGQPPSPEHETPAPAQDDESSDSKE